MVAGLCRKTSPAPFNGFPLPPLRRGPGCKLRQEGAPEGQDVQSLNAPGRPEAGTGPVRMLRAPQDGSPGRLCPVHTLPAPCSRCSKRMAPPQNEGDGTRRGDLTATWPASSPHLATAGGRGDGDDSSGLQSGGSVSGEHGGPSGSLRAETRLPHSGLRAPPGGPAAHGAVPH